MRCPVCRAENPTGPQCRRCRADLSLLFALEEQRGRLLTAAQAALQRGDGGETVRLATAAERLRHGDDAQRLLALGHLLNGDFAGAWESYAGQAAPPPEGTA
jgi:hypothetical protein